MHFNRNVNKRVADYGDTIVTNKDQYLVIDTSLISMSNYGLVSIKGMHVASLYPNTDCFYVGNELKQDEIINAVFLRD